MDLLNARRWLEAAIFFPRRSRVNLAWQCLAPWRCEACKLFPHLTHAYTLQYHSSYLTMSGTAASTIQLTPIRGALSGTSPAFESSHPVLSCPSLTRSHSHSALKRARLHPHNLPTTTPICHPSPRGSRSPCVHPHFSLRPVTRAFSVRRRMLPSLHAESAANLASATIASFSTSFSRISLPVRLHPTDTLAILCESRQASPLQPICLGAVGLTRTPVREILLYRTGCSSTYIALPRACLLLATSFGLCTISSDPVPSTIRVILLTPAQ